MGQTIGTGVKGLGLPPDLATVYLMTVEETFQGLRRSVSALSAMVLLFHTGAHSSAYPLDLGLEGTISEARRLTDAAQTIDRRFSKLPTHQSLVSSCLLVQLCCEQLGTAMRSKPDERTQAVATVLATMQQAYSNLKRFSLVTPWDPTSLNSSCACAIK